MRNVEDSCPVSRIASEATGRNQKGLPTLVAEVNRPIAGLMLEQGLSAAFPQSGGLEAGEQEAGAADHGLWPSGQLTERGKMGGKRRESGQILKQWASGFFPTDKN